MRKALIPVVAALLAAPFAVPESVPASSWTIENDSIAAVYAWYADGSFRMASLRDKRSNRVWAASTRRMAGLISLGGPGLVIGAPTRYEQPVVSETFIERGGKRLTFTLLPEGIAAEITLEAEVYPDQAFVRQHYRFKNLAPRNVTLTSAAFLDVSFEAERQFFRAFRVNQWVDGGAKGNFETQQAILGQLREPWLVRSGSYAQHCSWLALRDARNNGLAIGWEFNGRAQVSAKHDLGTASLVLAGDIEKLNQPLPPGESFDAPAVFIGSFRGDWDEAGYRTQRFADEVLASALPDAQKFPYVVWDSWGYQDEIDEALLRRAADVAARIGAEVFTVDLGWASRIGDWHADPARFPSGMRALSDYVRARGMKFGLHFPLVEADPVSAVLRQNPDWAASTSDGFYGAVSLCPGHEPVKQWLVGEAVRLIREYNVDWVLQDGVNMVKECTKRTHTHNRRNSNYANSVNGIDEIVRAIREQAPEAMWENCQSGGRMMTYQMIRQYDTSITSDDTGALSTRQAIWGATFPMPPRYTDRYTGDAMATKFNLRSGMFGGPWILMQRITEWSENEIASTAEEVARYKSLRLLIRDGKVFHHTSRPDGRHNEVMQSYNGRMDRSVIFVFRAEPAADSELVKPRGLIPESEYSVRLEEAGTTVVATGRDLMDRGIEVPLPEIDTAEIVYINPIR